MRWGVERGVVANSGRITDGPALRTTPSPDSPKIYSPYFSHFLAQLLCSLIPTAVHNS